MVNRLAQENSPYLLQHAQNPVDWYPWGEEALLKARQENKPIFLSIGYAACHWCHVMAHESFEDAQTADLMNRDFVCIKVDREERPDLDSIYMNAVVAMTGQGGWPMSVFLTPEGQPFFGGTYFPPARRYNMPSFKEVLQGVTQAWKNDRQNLEQSGKQLTNHLANAQGQGSRKGQTIEPARLDEAAFRLVQGYDWKHGGWGQAPKFPQPMAIEFLLRRAARGDRLAADSALHALRAMAKGGMYDVVGGGFARYSTDDDWRVPHFEKMLYDNAQLARVYLHGYLVSGDLAFRRVCESTLDFIARELMAQPEPGGSPQGGFYSSLDADSEGVEGKYYVWTPEQIRSALGTVSPGADFFLAAYGVRAEGNFDGKTVLQRALDDQALSSSFNLPVEQVPEILAAQHTRLLQARQERVRPGTDDKVLTAWNALALAAFAEAARYLERADYLEIARQNADFLLTELNPGERLLRSWRRKQARHSAYLEDYGALILGLLAIYVTDPDPYWFNSAVQLTEEMLAHYRDPQGGFFDTRDDQPLLITRPKDLQDNATPCGNALSAMALLQMAAYTGQTQWRELAEVMLAGIQETAERYPTAFGMWLSALDLAGNRLDEVAILGDLSDAGTQALIDVLTYRYRPGVMAAISAFPPPPNVAPLLQGRPLLNQAPTAYVCQQFACQRPVNTPEELEAQLNQ